MFFKKKVYCSRSNKLRSNKLVALEELNGGMESR